MPVKKTEAKRIKKPATKKSSATKKAETKRTKKTAIKKTSVARIRTPARSSTLARQPNMTPAERLRELPVSFHPGYEMMVMSDCASWGLQEYGAALVDNIRVLKQGLDERRQPFTGMLLISTVLETITMMAENGYSREFIIKTMRLCHYLMPALIGDQEMVLEAIDIIRELNQRSLMKHGEL